MKKTTERQSDELGLLKKENKKLRNDLKLIQENDDFSNVSLMITIQEKLIQLADH